MKTIFAFACLLALWGCNKTQPQKDTPVYRTDSVFRLLADSLRRELQAVEDAQTALNRTYANDRLRLERRQIAIETRLQLALDSAHAIDRQIDTALQPTETETLFGL